jgi:hypothetical protein
MMTDDTIIPAAGYDLGVPGAVAPPAPTPPMSMQEAAVRKTEFLANKEKTTALMNGDVGATNEWRNITDNLYQAPAIIGPRDQAAEDLNSSTGYALPDSVVDEYRRNDPVTPEVRRQAEHRWDALIRDPDFIARFNRKEPEAMRQWGAIVSIRSRPVRDNPQGGNESAQS